jgi:hypothetical protein
MMAGRPGSSPPPKAPFPPAHVRRALKQGIASVENAPDGAVVLFRKAVQLAVSDTEIKGGKFGERLKNLERARRLDSIAVKACNRVSLVGDWGVHTPQGVTSFAAEESLVLCLLSLDSLGYDVSPAGHIADVARVRRYLSELPNLKWEGPAKFDGTWLSGLQYGGTIDVMFGCLKCGAEVYCEDLSVPAPSFMADSQSDSMTYEGTYVDCSFCGEDYEVTSTNSYGGWDVDIPSALGQVEQRRHGNPSPSYVRLPPAFHYLYRVTFEPGNEADEHETVEAPPPIMETKSQPLQTEQKTYDLDW